MQPGEVLAVAYEYQYDNNGTPKTVKVGEFSDNNPENPSGCIYTKLLKGTEMSPAMKYWDLMMKTSIHWELIPYRKKSSVWM